MVGCSAHAHGLGARISSVQLQVSSVQLPVIFSFGMAEQEGTPQEGTPFTEEQQLWLANFLAKASKSAETSSTQNG